MTAQETKILRIQLYHPFMGVHNFDISSRQNFTDLRNMLYQHTQMTIFENFRFEANGKLLPQFQEIGQVIQNQTRVNLVLQPFDQRSSYYHLDRVKDVLANPIQWVMLNTRETNEQPPTTPQTLPPNTSIDTFLDLHLTSPLQCPQSLTQSPFSPTTPQFLQSLSLSIHNPPPLHRKLAGDFYYLQIKTLEGYEEHVTACPAGFYVNGSSSSCFSWGNFNGVVFCNLLELLKWVSPKFKEVFGSLRKLYKVGELDKAIYSSFKSAPTCQWLKPTPQPKKPKPQWRPPKPTLPTDNTTIKDWNQILQLNTILPTDTDLQICNKQKNHTKLYQQFVAFAREAAVKAVDSQIGAKNGAVFMEERVFGYGSVFLWFAQGAEMGEGGRVGGKGREIGKEGIGKGKEMTKEGGLTRKAVNAEVRNLGILANMEGVKVALKHTVLVSYKGYNVVVQTIVPGATPTPKTPPPSLQKPSQKSQKIQQQLSKLLKIQHRNFQPSTSTPSFPIIHPQLLLHQQSPTRTYALNLHSLSIHDPNYPTPPNPTTYFRQELINLYNEKYGCLKNVNAMVQSGYQVVDCQAYRDAGRKMREIGVFAEEVMVGVCLMGFLRGWRRYLADSKSVVKVMHKYGLSSRYLGSLYKKSINYDSPHITTILQRTTLTKTLKNIFRHHLRRCQQGDIKSTIARLLNCIFCSESTQNSMQEICSKEEIKDQGSISTTASRRRKRKVECVVDGLAGEDFIVVRLNGVGGNGVGGSGVGGSGIRPMELWEQVKEVALVRYGVKFEEARIGMLKCMENQFGKCALLRDLCISLGIVLQKTEYFQKQGLIFKPQNIEQLKPLTKHIPLKNNYLQNLTKTADNLLQKKRIEQALDTYNQAINYATSNFGMMTEQLAQLNKKISEIYFRIGEVDTAVIFIHCAQKMCEKIFGDSYVDTLECYGLLSQYYFFMRSFQTAEYYLIKAIHIGTVSYGEEYPELIIWYLNLSTLYQACLRFMDSITCISHALRIVLRVFGEKHMNTVICYAAMSTAHFQIPDIQKSIFFQQKSLQIMKQILKQDDPRLKQSQKVLQYYHNLQSTKKVKQSYQKERKKFITNPQLYAGFPLFRMPEYTKDREFLYKKMVNFGGSGKFFG